MDIQFFNSLLEGGEIDSNEVEVLDDYEIDLYLHIIVKIEKRCRLLGI